MEDSRLAKEVVFGEMEGKTKRKTNKRKAGRCKGMV